MRFGSVCSGIEAASVAWHPLGWRAAWFSEIEPFPCAVLAHHYPEVPNHGDMTTLPQLIRSGKVEAPDLFCGGTPCQAFSVAGLRRSLDDERGNLSLTFVEIADAIDDVRRARGDAECIVFWENVPGVLSTADNAFGCFLGALAGCDTAIEPLAATGWTDAGVVAGPQRTVAWRVLDAQYFGLAQRRRRVFVVASARAGFDPAAVLFEWEGLRRDTAPSREAREGAAICPTLRAGGNSTGGDRPPGTDVDTVESLQVVQPYAVGNTLTARMHKGINTTLDEGQTPVLAHALRGEGFDASEDGTGRGTPLVPVAFDTYNQTISETAQTLCSRGDTPGGNAHLVPAVLAHAFDARQSDVIQYGDKSGPLDTDGHSIGVAVGTDCYNGAITGDVAATLGTPGSSVNASGPTVMQAVAALFIQDDTTPKVNKERAGCLRRDAGGEGACVMTPAMQVRRLTPVECERLQGFPTVLEKLTLEVCGDPQNSSVHVAIQCHRWQNSAWPADASGLMQRASIAAAHSSTRQANQEPLAALHVRMHSVDELLEIRSAGKSTWSASGAGQSKKCLPPTLTENSVQELARLQREVAHLVRSGKAGSQPSIRLSFPASSGATSAEKFGQETEGRVSGAASDRKLGTFTTSDLGLITSSCDSTAAIFCCSVLHAIAGCIPSETLPETFSIELTVETPYTAIPWRGKPADQCPDGPRYKALGNSWAVPVVRWIGERIHRAVLTA